MFTYDTFTKIDKFAVNILRAGDQKDIAMLFATKDADRFGNSEWHKSEFGLPIIEGALASLQCKTFKAVEDRRSYNFDW